MRQLVITKIEAHGNWKYLTCEMTATKDYGDFINHPDSIHFLGDRYVRMSWSSNSKTIHYRTN